MTMKIVRSDRACRLQCINFAEPIPGAKLDDKKDER
jgi:hypothetical protein